MIQKLFIVSNDPEIIWKEINLQNPGFFVEVIKQEFGIADGFSKKIYEDFAAQSREYYFGQFHSFNSGSNIIKHFPDLPTTNKSFVS